MLDNNPELHTEQTEPHKQDANSRIYHGVFDSCDLIAERMADFDSDKH